MKLTSVTYSEFAQDHRRWELDSLDLNDINLIIGKNASGKSRSLNIISGLANLIINPTLYIKNGNYNAEFKNNNERIIYEFSLFNSRVINETLTINGSVKLSRKPENVGEMFNVEANKSLKFKLPPNVLAITRRDSLQYPYLDIFADWANNVRHFKFGTDLGQNSFMVGDTSVPETFNIRETDKAIQFFQLGRAKFGSDFTSAIISDLDKLGYYLENIDIGAPITITDIQGPNLGQVSSLLIKEKDIKCLTDQIAMSSGMYRAVSLLIHLNFYQLSQISGTIIIDDIGEGLDFDRSTNLINLLTEKAKTSNIQLIMSTNDRFVMNNTSLEYWQLIIREGSVVKIINHQNSPEIFEEFKYTGLNNFDFFATDFYKDGFTQDELSDNE